MIETKRNDGDRIYIKVLAFFPRNAFLPEPKAMYWEDELLPIRIIKVRAGASLKIAEEGIRFTCAVGSRIINLFYEVKRWRWYFEQRISSEGMVSLPPDRRWAIAEHDGKVYVDVLALCRTDGRPPIPQKLWWTDGREFIIDDVDEDDIHQAASQVAGAVGLMYLCLIKGFEKHLFFEFSIQRWFVERKAVAGNVR